MIPLYRNTSLQILTHRAYIGPGKAVTQCSCLGNRIPGSRAPGKLREGKLCHPGSTLIFLPCPQHPLHSSHRTVTPWEALHHALPGTPSPHPLPGDSCSSVKIQLQWHQLHCEEAPETHQELGPSCLPSIVSWPDNPFHSHDTDHLLHPALRGMLPCFPAHFS